MLLLVCLALLGMATAAGTASSQTTTPPLDLTAIALSVHQVDLAWSRPAESTFSYTIRRNDVLLATVYGDMLTYIDTSVRPGTTYTYTVVALFSGWTESPPSSPMVVRTPALPDTPDTTAPSPPSDLMAVYLDNAVLLDWLDASDDTDISAYLVRRDGLLIATLNSGTLSYTDTTVLAAASYLYSVEAVDVLGQHSQRSNLAAIVVPIEPYPL